jgi:hypothetical protein
MYGLAAKSGGVHRGVKPVLVVKLIRVGSGSAGGGDVEELAYYVQTRTARTKLAGRSGLATKVRIPGTRLI